MDYGIAHVMMGRRYLLEVPGGKERHHVVANVIYNLLSRQELLMLVLLLIVDNMPRKDIAWLATEVVVVDRVMEDVAAFVFV